MNLPHDRSVLIVDDDPGIRLLLVTFLRHRGFRLLEARNGNEALSTMRAGGADLVIMDLMMPEVSGWDVLRARAADPFFCQIPVIIITANGSREVAADLLAADVYAVLGKPFDLDALLNVVTACLSHPAAPVLPPHEAEETRDGGRVRANDASEVAPPGSSDIRRAASHIGRGRRALLSEWDRIYGCMASVGDSIVGAGAAVIEFLCLRWNDMRRLWRGSGIGRKLSSSDSCGPPRPA